MNQQEEFLKARVEALENQVKEFELERKSWIDISVRMGNYILAKTDNEQLIAFAEMLKIMPKGKKL